MKLIKLCRRPGVALVFLVAGVPAWGQSQADGPLQQGDVFPDLAAESLAESQVELPRALQEEPAIVIVTFSKAGGEAASEWAASIREQLPEQVASNLWLAMVLDGVPRLLRGFVVGGIKRGVPDATHPRTLTLYQDGEEWRRRCAIESEDIPCVMLLDGRSLIRWIRTDRVSEAQIDTLEREVLALR